jgi:hypothetical protein
VSTWIHESRLTDHIFDRSLIDAVVSAAQAVGGKDGGEELGHCHRLQYVPLADFVTQLNTFEDGFSLVGSS